MMETEKVLKDLKKVIEDLHKSRSEIVMTTTELEEIISELEKIRSEVEEEVIFSPKYKNESQRKLAIRKKLEEDDKYQELLKQRKLKENHIHIVNLEIKHLENMKEYYKMLYQYAFTKESKHLEVK